MQTKSQNEKHGTTFPSCLGKVLLIKVKKVREGKGKKI